MTKDDFTKLFSELSPTFNKSDLYQSAITHKSYYFEGEKDRPHNERLEFLGDAVLNLLVAKGLYLRFPEHDEGFLTKARSNLVNTKTLAEKAKLLDLGNQIRLGKSEKGENGARQPRVLASVLEAVIGASYLELGIEKTNQFIEMLFEPEFASEDLLRVSDSDWKSKLQEELQREFQKTPTYEIVDTVGPDHQRSFRVVVIFENETLATGEGLSKKEAEQMAAKNALEFRAQEKIKEISGEKENEL